jgi:hypothetical protein
MLKTEQPAGACHRLSLDDEEGVTFLRLFEGKEPGAILQPSDRSETRLEYFNRVCSGPVNGRAVILQQRAKAYAKYPHARLVNGFIYLSGTSSRRPDNTHVRIRPYIVLARYSTTVVGRCRTATGWVLAPGHQGPNTCGAGEYEVDPAESRR